LIIKKCQIKTLEAGVGIKPSDFIGDFMFFVAKTEEICYIIVTEDYFRGEIL
jgi:hypothetical protein